MAELDFDVDDAGDNESFSAVPPGEYKVVVLSTEEKVKEKGRTLQIQMKISDGDYANRQIWDFLLVHHTSQKAQDISRARLKELKNAAGLEKLVDTDELIGSEVLVKVSTEMNDYRGEVQNRVKKYMPVNGKPAPKKAEQQPPAKADASKPAWAKK